MTTAEQSQVDETEATVKSANPLGEASGKRCLTRIKLPLPKEGKLNPNKGGLP